MCAIRFMLQSSPSFLVRQCYSLTGISSATARCSGSFFTLGSLPLRSRGSSKASEPIMKAIAPMCRAGFPGSLREPPNRFDARKWRGSTEPYLRLLHRFAELVRLRQAIGDPAGIGTVALPIGQFLHGSAL